MKLVWILAVFIPLVMVGCGSSNSTSTTPEDPAYSHLPPDPGEAGKATLEGIDSDNDGVRDDLQIAIFKRHPDNAQVRAALEQNAKAFQEALIAGSRDDVEEIFKVATRKARATICLHRRLNTMDASRDRSFVEASAANTEERIEAYIKFNQTLSGHRFGFDGIDKANSCD